MNKKELRETRKQMFAQMEQRLQEMHPKEEDREIRGRFFDPFLIKGIK